MDIVVEWSDGTFNAVSQLDLLPSMECNELAAWIHDLGWICRIRQFSDPDNILVTWIRDSTENILSTADICATLESKTVIWRHDRSWTGQIRQSGKLASKIESKKNSSILHQMKRKKCHFNR